MMHRLHAIVEGRVQGVGYRAFVVEIAQRLELTGWVRNVSTGAVEVTAEGERLALEKLLDMLEIGPGMSAVDNVAPEWSDASGEFKSFQVRHNLYI